MHAERQQILACYEQEGMTPEQIAEDRELEVDTVKLVLMQCSSKYRTEMKQQGKAMRNFSDAAYELAMQRMEELLHSDSDIVAVKAATYIIDEKKGRNDAKVAKQMGNFNVLVINQQMSRAKEALQRARESKQLPSSPALKSDATIDLQPEEVKEMAVA